MVFFSSRLRSVLTQFPTEGLPPRVLNVGCGDYPAAAALRQAREGWTLYGLDRDEAALRRARQSDPALRLVCADARDAPRIFRARFGLVLVRHPDIFRDKAMWAVALPRLLALLAAGGVLLITCYTAEESALLAALELPPALALDEDALAPPNLAGHDRYLHAYPVGAHSDFGAE